MQILPQMREGTALAPGHFRRQCTFKTPAESNDIRSQLKRDILHHSPPFIPILAPRKLPQWCRATCCQRSMAGNGSDSGWEAGSGSGSDDDEAFEKATTLPPPSPEAPVPAPKPPSSRFKQKRTGAGGGGGPGKAKVAPGKGGGTFSGTKVLDVAPEEGQGGDSEYISAGLVEAEQPEAMRSTLLPFQRESLTWMVAQEHGMFRGGLLADEMGMGKTVQAIA